MKKPSFSKNRPSKRISRTRAGVRTRPKTGSSRVSNTNRTSRGTSSPTSSARRSSTGLTRRTTRSVPKRTSRKGPNRTTLSNSRSNTFARARNAQNPQHSQNKSVRSKSKKVTSKKFPKNEQKERDPVAQNIRTKDSKERKNKSITPLRKKRGKIVFVPITHHLNRTHFNEEDISYPIRINRLLYILGYCSRRQADQFIEAGMVQVNDGVAWTGHKIENGDKISVAEEVIDLKKSFTYYVYNKPVGIVSHNPQEGEKSIEDVFKTSEQVFPVGRLDKASEGLMFMTSDRRIINKIIAPSFEHEKEYLVTVDKEAKERDARHMSNGIMIEGYKTKPAEVSVDAKKRFRFVLTEGKKHQIRRMCAAKGYQVKQLQRVRIMHLHLGRLPVGKGRELTFPERKQLLESVGMFE